MNDQTDSQLLGAWANTRSEPAFAELVGRHVDLVYSAAQRMVCDAHLAEDVTQRAFVALAKNAAQVAGHPVLSGWLHRTAQNIAAETVRSDVRRRAHEQEAATMNELLAENGCGAGVPPAWFDIAPHLDAALGELSEPDRDAMLLRYFENKTLTEVGAVLGVSEDAVRMRVNRALEKLRDFFAKRGMTVGASGLVVVISANAVQAAPVGLAATILTAATLAGTTAAFTATATAIKTITMTTLQKTIIGVTLAAAVGTGVFQAHQNSKLREQNQTLQQQQAPLAEQIRQLQRERDDAANRLSALANEMERIKGNSTELLRLRGEVARLRNDSQELARLKAANAMKLDDPTESAMKSWIARVNDLKQRFERTPGAKIPELKFLTEQAWLDVAKGQFKTDEDYQKALATLRMEGSSMFLGSRVDGPLREYMQGNNGQFPKDISQLQPYFKSSQDYTILQRYQIIPAIYLGNDASYLGDWAITQKSAVDEENDVRVSIGLKGTVRSYRTETDRALDSAISAFAAANNGRLPQGIFDLQLYITPAEQEAFQKRIRDNRTYPPPSSTPIR